MCLPPKMYAHVPALVAEWAALGEGGGPDVNGHSHLGGRSCKQLVWWFSFWEILLRMRNSCHPNLLVFLL